MPTNIVSVCYQLLSDSGMVVTAPPTIIFGQAETWTPVIGKTFRDVSQ